MDKKELLVKISKQTTELSNIVNGAGIETSFSGRYEHAIAYGLAMPLTMADQYFQRVVGVIENPEIGKEYSALRFIKRAQVEKAEQASEQALEKIPMNLLEKMDSAMQQALVDELNASVHYYATAIRERGGQSLTQEDLDNLQPVMATQRFLKQFCDLSDIYNPSSE